MPAVCAWPCLAGASSVNPKPVDRTRSFAHVLQDSCVVQISQLPSLTIKGDDVHIKITQSEYEKGLEECRKHLHGRMLLNKGDKPLTAKDLKAKLSLTWKTQKPWHLVSLGRGFYEFQFVSYEDMHLAWSMGSINLQSGLLRLSKWTNDFNPYTQRQTHAQVWIRLMELPQEYWRRRTLFEIASAIGTPLLIDDSTRNRTFGHYARLLVDVDLSRRLFDDIVVEREGYTFKLVVQYEKLPSFCTHCQIIGHFIANCTWLHPSLEKQNHGKQHIEIPRQKITQKYAAKTTCDVPGPSNTTAAMPAVAKEIVIPVAIAPTPSVETTSFHMALHNVVDEE